MKLTKLAVIIGLAGSTLAMLTSSAQAFNILFLGKEQQPVTYNGQQVDVFNYSLDVEPKEKFLAGTEFYIKNIENVLGSGVTPGGSADISFDPLPTKGIPNAAYWVTTKDITQGVYETFQVYTALNSKIKQDAIGCFDVNCNPEYSPIPGPGGGAAAVPEAESALVPFVALGFGYLYRRKKQKNIQDILASKGQ